MRRWIVVLPGLAAVVAGAVVLWPEEERSPRPAAPARAAPSAEPPAAAEEDPPPPAEPEVQPGEEITIELLEPPVETYASPPRDGPDFAGAGVVAALGRRDVAYDPLLGRAARELANQQAIFEGVVPADVVDFVLRSSGAVDRTVMQGYAATRGDGDALVRSQIEEAVARGGAAFVRVGVGEVWLPGAKLDRVLGVIVSRHDVEVDPAPRRVEPGGEWVLSGRLPREFADPTALVLREPEGALEEAPVAADRGRFRVAVAAGAAKGRLTVSVTAVGPHGPMPLLQLPIEVGRPVPDTLTTRVPPDESAIQSPEAAEALALRLLDADRARFELPALPRDPALDAIARAHSADMRDARFFGHVSRTTGAPSDRIARARYRARRHAENVATGGSIQELQSGLLASLPHRRNILSPEMTRVGIGVAMSRDGGRSTWHLTQLFAEPPVAIDAAREADRIEQAIVARRRAAGAPALARDASLDRIAGEHARLGLAPAETLSRLQAAAERAGLSWQGTQAWAMTGPGLDDLALPEVVMGRRLRRVGVGVHQIDDAEGTVAVVLLLAPEGGD